ncbi:MAG: hypothetical protein ACTSQE_05705 [Candidatus Heimdallarchaeaceae archaeon]
MILLYFTISNVRGIMVGSNLGFNEIKEDQTISEQSSMLFQILSPINGTIYNITNNKNVKVSYILDPIDANVTFWLNNTLLSVSNNSNITLSFKGTYNLTAIASYGDNIVHQVVFFTALAPLEAQIKLLNPPGYRSGWSQGNNRVYVFSPNTTISLLVTFTELNANFSLDLRTVNLTKIENETWLHERNYTSFALGSANYTWLNQSTINLLIDPLFSNYTIQPFGASENNWGNYYSIGNLLPMDGYSQYELVIHMWSSLFFEEYVNTTYRFGRDYYSPIVTIHSPDDFLTVPQSGVVSPILYFWDSSDILCNETTIYIDGQKVADGRNLSYINNGFYTFSLILDTIQYTNGQHNITIITSDIYHHSTVQTFLFYIFNPTKTTNPPPTTDTTYSPFIGILTALLLYSKIHTRRKRISSDH